MATRILLYVSDQQACAALWRDRKLGRSGALSRVTALDNGAPGWRAFSNWLAASPGVPVLIAVDSVQEDYRCETLPHVSGRARQEMLSRRLKQAFRNTPWCAAWPQGSNTAPRREDTFLFASLTAPAALSPWLDAIQAQGNPLAGVHLLPVAVHALLGRLRLRERHLLVVTQGSGGLRQSYFRDGHLQISRLTREPAGDETARATHCRDEIGQTRAFLNGQRQMLGNGRLSAILLDCQEGFAALHQQLAADPNLTVRRIGSEEIGAALGVDPGLLRASPNALYLLAMGLHPLPANLAPPQLAQGFRAYRARRALYRLSLAVLLAALSLSGANLYRRLALLDQVSATTAAIRRDEARYLDIVRQFPAAPALAANLRNAVETARALQRASRTPESLLAVVSRALDQHPDIQLSRLQWQRSGDAAGGDGPARSSIAAGGATAFLEGEVAPFHGDYRAAIASVEAFADRLRRDQAVAAASALRLPLDITPASSLNGSTAASHANAPFRLKVTLKAGA